MSIWDALAVVFLPAAIVVILLILVTAPFTVPRLQ